MLCVPPRLPVADLRAAELELYSMLSPDAYWISATEGVLRCRPDLIDEEIFRDAYDWLRDQARRRVPGAQGTYPIWLWASTNSRDLRYNVRHAARFRPGSVLITCRIRRERCLLSHYDDWHDVLNAQPHVPWDRALDPEADAYGRCLDSAMEEFDVALRDAGLNRLTPFRGWPADLQASVSRSWEAILDIDDYPPGEYWQATVEEVRADDVIRVVRPWRERVPWRRGRDH